MSRFNPFNNKSGLRIFYIISDFITGSLAFFIFDIMRFIVIHQGNDSYTLESFLLEPKLILEQISIPLMMVVIYALSGYYNIPFPRSRLHEMMITLGSAGVIALIIFLGLLINDPTPRKTEEYGLLVMLFLTIFILTYFARLFITTRALHEAIRHPRPYVSLIVGDSEKGRAVAAMLLKQKKFFIPKILGYVPLSGEKIKNHSDEKQTDAIFPRENLRETCIRYNVDQVVVVPVSRNDKEVMSIVDEIIDLNIPIKIAPDDFSYALAGIRLNDVTGIPLIDLASPPIGPLQQNLKRTFDVFLSSLALIFLSPLLIGLGIAIKCGSKGPVLYRQERIGRNHRPFHIIKFRSMYEDAEASGPQLSSDTDSRITPIGRVMRKYRLDELPQFWNVIKGDMSIVGPRPEREFYIRQIVKHVPLYSLVFQIRPGITSWAMVKYGYASTLRQMCARTPYDLIYINNMSLLLDIKILVHTVLTVIRGVGK